MTTKLADLCDLLAELEDLNDVNARVIYAKMVAWKTENPRTYRDAINYKPFRLLWQAVATMCRFQFRDELEDMS
jgi:hypothetical protein